MDCRLNYYNNTDKARRLIATIILLNQSDDALNLGAASEDGDGLFAAGGDGGGSEGGAREGVRGEEGEEGGRWGEHGGGEEVGRGHCRAKELWRLHRRFTGGGEIGTAVSGGDDGLWQVGLIDKATLRRWAPLSKNFRYIMILCSAFRHMVHNRVNVISS